MNIQRRGSYFVFTEREREREREESKAGGKGEATVEKPSGVKSLNAARRRTVGRILRAGYGCLKATHRFTDETVFSFVNAGGRRC